MTWGSYNIFDPDAIMTSFSWAQAYDYTSDAELIGWLRQARPLWTSKNGKTFIQGSADHRPGLLDAFSPSGPSGGEEV
jgi:hypothetical protein